jgi:KDO2-lipid IV(A) lauroyltransferase
MRSRYLYSSIAVRILAGLIRVSRWVPRKPALAAGEMLGRLMYLLARVNSMGRRKEVRGKRHTFIDLSLHRSLEDLSRAFGPGSSPRELTRLAKGSFLNAGRSMIETLRIPTLPKPELLSLVDADSFDPVHQVLDRGNGLIVLTPHLGAWEVLASYLVLRLDRPFSAIVQRQRYSPYDTLFHSIRFEGAGVKVIYQDSGARPLLTALRENLPVGVLGDLDMPKLNGTFVQFFGRPAYTPVGPAALARASGAGMVPIFIRWKAGPSAYSSPRHHVHILPEIEFVRSADKQADILENTQRWTRVIEGIVRDYPEQWIWFHRRWATRENSGGCPSSP